MRKSLGLTVVLSVGVFACGGYEEDLGEINQGVGGSAVMFPCPSGGLPSGGAPQTGYSFQNGVKVHGGMEEPPYDGTFDTFIYQDSPATNYGSSNSCIVDGGSDKRSCLLRWSSLPIPTDVTVLGAAITLELTNGTAGTINILKMTRSWSEDGATWTNAALASPWASPGATGSTDAAPTVLGTLTGAGTRTVCLNAAGVAAVQDWVTNPSNNRGVLLGTSSSDGVYINSSESPTLTQRPKLTVRFTPD